MHVNLQRQLRVAIFTAVIAVFHQFAVPSRAQTPGPSNPPEVIARELQAVKLMESTLRIQGVTSEKQRKIKEKYAQLATNFPKDVPVKNAYAAFLWESGEYAHAERLWKESERIEPNNGVTQHGLGTAALASGDVRRAADCMTKASTSQPNNATFHFDLANLLFLFRHQLLDEAHTSAESVIARALTHYAEACRLAPLNAEFAQGHAETFYSLPTPDWPAAIAAWKHLLEISPRKDFALANLATIYLKLGQKNEARAHAAQMNSPEFAKRKARLLERIEKE